MQVRQPQAGMRRRIDGSGEVFSGTVAHAPLRHHIPVSYSRRSFLMIVKRMLKDPEDPARLAEAVVVKVIEAVEPFYLYHT